MCKPIMMMYIDSNNFYKNVQALYGAQRVNIYWNKVILGIRNKIQQDYDCYFSKAYYYSALSDREDNPTIYDKHSAFLASLNAIPYIDVVIGKLTRVPIDSKIPIDKNNPATYKHVEKNTDINISNDMLLSTADIVVLLSVDSDFENTVNLIKSKGKKVLLVVPIGAKSSQMQQIVGRENIIFLDKAFFDNCSAHKV